ncbi:MAG: SDR family NAD(P)-dependent oxidoreductase [Candidatus Thermoplasmatota archaeon]
MRRPVLVTGASRGIGRATALRLAAAGYAIGINFNRSLESARRVKEEIETMGGEAILLQASVAVEEDVRAMVHSLTREFGEIYGLVNNAGIYPRTKFDRMSLDTWNETIAVNLTGAFLCTRTCLPHLREGGRIVNVASELAYRGSAQGAHYTASKAGLIGLTRALARELAPRQITVNAVAPGPTDTDIISSDTPEKRRQREREIPLGRVGRPEEIAGAVAYLLSDDAAYITGAVISVTGGLVMI